MLKHEQPLTRSKLPPSAKWGEVANAGFQILPDALLKYQTELGLDATDMLVLINITMHWWYEDQRPFPRTTTIAKRMGVSVRTVQRSASKLQKLKLIERKKEDSPSGDGERTVYDLTGLIRSLEPHAKNDEGYRPRFGDWDSDDDLDAVEFDDEVPY